MTLNFFRNSILISVALVALCALIVPSKEVKAQKQTEKKLNRLNLAFLYSESGFTDFDALVYHHSAKKSTVYLNVKLQDFIYKKDLEDGTHSSEFMIRYALFDSYESKTASDTGSMFIRDTTHFGMNTDLILNFEIQAIYPEEYVLQITLTDQFRQNNPSVTKFFPVSKKSRTSSQNYMAVDESGVPIFGLSLQGNRQFRIRFNNDSIAQLTIRYYNKELPLAKTPFVIDKVQPLNLDTDSLYSLNLTQGETDLIRLRYPGIYLFQSISSVSEGLTLYRFDDGFPEIQSPLEALKPLRYLTTQKEYDELINQEDLKSAVDQFWLERASNQPERAKNLISRYYKRVTDANRFFTSFKEGWKTDRGIIYIIYGPPSEVYRKTGEEEWIYGEKSNLLSIRFFFDHIGNPLSDHDFMLQRSTMYKTSWYIAVENWRR